MSDGKEDKRDGRDKYYSLKKDNKLLEDKLRPRWEKDAINIRREVGEKRMTLSTDCHTLGHIVLPDHVLNLHPQSLLEAPRNVKLKEKDENECLVTGCTKLCHSHMTSRVIPDNHLKLYTSEYHQHDLVTWSTLEEDNGKGEIHLTSNDTLRRLMETVQHVCSESGKSCQEPSLLTNNESELAKLIMKSLTELSCNDERGVERFEEFVKELKDNLAKVRGEGGRGGESLEEEEQFLKVLLDYITYTRSLRNTRKADVDDFIFNKNHNFRTSAELLNIPRTSTRLIDNNLLHKRHNTEVLKELINFEIISVAEKKRRDDSLSSQLKDAKKGVLLVPVGVELKEHSLLLKKMKLLPQQQLYEAKGATSGVHEGEEGKRKRRMKLSRVTREIRARMRRKTEQKREDLATDSSDEN